jgi:hypothetical protein
VTSQSNAPSGWHEAAEALRAKRRASLAWFPNPAELELPPWHDQIGDEIANHLDQNAPPGVDWDYTAISNLLNSLLWLRERARFADLILYLLELLSSHPQNPYPGVPPFGLFVTFEVALTPEDGWVIEWLLKIVTLPISEIVPTKDFTQFANQMWGNAGLRALVGTLALVGHISDVRVVSVLMDALSGPDELRAVAAESVVGELGITAAVEPLIARLYHNGSDRTIEALGKLRAHRAVDPLLEMLRGLDINESLTFNAIADALGRIGDQRAVDSLAPFLKKRNLRLNTALALQRMGDQRGLQYIIDAATRRNEPSWEAARRLVKLGDPRGIQAMQAMYQHLSTHRSAGSPDVKLRDLNRYGTLSDIPFLEWVRTHDFRQYLPGQSLAELADSAIVRTRALIEAHPHLAD